MARARSIKPGFYKNEYLAECSVWARLIYPGLWMLADREGRLEDRPKRIQGELLPFDAQDVEPLLRELHRGGFILRYETGGVRYIQILKFSDHQSPHYSEKASVIPAHKLPEDAPHMQPQDSGNDCGMNGRDSETTPGALQEPSEKPPPIKRGPQPPFSLTPDFLTPDCPNPESFRPTVPDAPPHALPRARNGTAAGTLSIAMRQNGVMSQPAEPRLMALADAGVTPETMAQACQAAHEAKGPNVRIAPAYVYAIVERWMAEPASRPPQSHESVAAETIRMIEREQQERARAAQ